MRPIKLILVASVALAATLLLAPSRAEAGSCGNGSCQGGENALTCPADCPGFCNDGVCTGTENCATCSADCGACTVGCGDYVCSDSESCSSCATDCGACPGYPQLRDFAMCPEVLPFCDETTTACCKRPFESFDGRLPIVIPMDRCHQPMLPPPGGNKYDIPTQAAAWCVDPGQRDADDPVTGNNRAGMIYAYGLIYRLMQHGIPVYWAINPTKDPQTLNEAQANLAAQTYNDRDIDMWILSPNDADGAPPVLGGSLSACGGGCASPVVRLNADLSHNTRYSMTEFPLRGSAFIIAARDRDRFDAFIRQTGEFAALYGNPLYDFSSVDMYEIQDGARIVYQNFRNSSGPYPTTPAAPIAVTLDTPPPRLAVQDGGPARNWLRRANLDHPAAPGCETGASFTPADAVYCDMSASEIDSGGLIAGSFDWAWLHAPGLSCSAMPDLDEFMTAVPGVKDGHHVMFMETPLALSESCTEGRFLGVASAGVTPDSLAGAAPYVLRYPSNLVAQIGDVPAGFAQGSPTKWSFNGGTLGNLYRPEHYAWGAGGTLVRLVSEDKNSLCTAPLNKSTATCDLFVPGQDDVDFVAYIRHESSPINGIGFYAAGNNINPVPTTAHLRMTMNAFLALPTGTVDVTPPEVFVEVSRAAPVVVVESGARTIYHGSFERPDPAPGPAPTVFNGASSLSTFLFPHTRGHFRARDMDDATADPFFDVADGGIPPAVPGGCGSRFTATCRTVFTTTGTGRLPTPIYFETASAPALNDYFDESGAVVDLTDVESAALIAKVLAGRLGGVDRSTPAIIGPSAVAPAGMERPTMAYFGALDGGMHAVCVEAKAGTACQRAGQELWSYIPRTQLPLIRQNLQRIDGSPSVADLYGDFNDDGDNEWATILTFMTGSGEPNKPLRAPVLVAMDISNPASPKVLWDSETGGVGLTLTSGPVRIGVAIEPVIYTATNRGPAVSGVTLAAVHAVTGDIIWANDMPYPASRDLSNPRVPASGIPGGATGVDMTRSGTVTHLLLPTLYGDLWLIDATNGANVHAPNPLFRFADDFHPIGAPATTYLDNTGKLHAIVASGGYADPFDTSWAPATVNQYVISVALDWPSGAGSITDDPANDFGGSRAFRIDLGPGNRVFSQVVVAGGDLYVVTDSEDVNIDTYGLGGDTGTLTRYSLSDGSAKGSAVTLRSGAGGVDVTSTGEAVSGAGGGVNIEAPTDFNAAGRSTELGFTARTGREVWLRLQ